jgi:hypothetical protein
VTAPAPLAAALALALAAPALADDDTEVRGRALLHLRITDLRNVPDGQVLFDPSTRTFAVRNYLGPGPAERYASSFVSAGLDGFAFSDRLRFALTVDTGEVRRTRLPQTAIVCPSAVSPSGLDLSGSPGCLVPLRLPVPSTRLGPYQVTSNLRPIEEEAEATLFVREAFVAASVGRAAFATLRAGRRHVIVGDGFVYDDYGLGLEADLDLGAIGPAWDVGLAAFYPTRDLPTGAALRSPLLALRVDHLPSLFEHAGIFAAFAHDETGSVSELFRSATMESEAMRIRGTAPGTPEYVAASRNLAATLSHRLQGSSNLVWVGTSGHLLVGGGHEASWTAALLAGRIHLLLPRAALPPIEVDAGALGELVSLRYRKALGEASVGAFFLWQSGDLPPAEKARLGLSRDYRGFLGVAPYVSATNLFFQGGVSESFAARQATAPGVNARGVVAPGLTASWDPRRGLALDAKGAFLLADEVGPFGGRVYGTELDVSATWSPAGWLSVVAEGDALWPADFFDSRRTVTKLVLGVDLVTP